MKLKTKSRCKTSKPRKQSATPPRKPATPAIASGAAPQMWHFQHQRPGIAGIMHCVVQAPDIQNARGAAYLIAEQFSENIIGFIKANTPTQLPDRAA